MGQRIGSIAAGDMHTSMGIHPDQVTQTGGGAMTDGSGNPPGSSSAGEGYSQPVGPTKSGSPMGPTNPGLGPQTDYGPAGAPQGSVLEPPRIQSFTQHIYTNPEGNAPAFGVNADELDRQRAKTEALPKGTATQHTVGTTATPSTREADLDSFDRMHPKGDLTQTVDFGSGNSDGGKVVSNYPGRLTPEQAESKTSGERTAYMESHPSGAGPKEPMMADPEKRPR